MSISDVYAAPKDPRNGGPDCNTVYDKKEKKYNETCCWREMVPGQILGNTYCQTCERGTNNCGDKVLQRYLLEETKPVNPLVDNDIVTGDPTPLQPSSPTSDSGVIVREPLQQLESNDNDNEVDESLSRDSQSNSDGVGDTDSPQEGDVSDNSEEFTNSNDKRTNDDESLQ